MLDLLIKLFCLSLAGWLGFVAICWVFDKPGAK